MVNRQKGEYLPALIREARGLNGEEKSVLHSVLSHESHIEYGSREVFRVRSGLSERKLRRSLTVLNRLGLIRSVERSGTTTRHELNVPALREFARVSASEPEATIALVRGHRQDATSAVSGGARPSRERTLVQAGRARPVQGERRKKNPGEEEREVINKNQKTFGRRLGSQAVSEMLIDALLAGEDRK